MSCRLRPAARFALLAWLLPTAGLAGAVSGDETTAARWQFQLRADRHSDVLSLADLEAEDLDRLQARRRRNLAYVDDEARLSRSAGSWTWSLLARSTATLVVNRDAVNLLNHASGRTSRDGDRQWQAEARLRGFNGTGLELRRDLPLGAQWRVSWSAQALTLMRWRERRIDGPVEFADAQSSYRFDLRSSETNDRLHFPFQKDSASRGAGLLFGGELAWQDEDFGLSLAARDAGWLRWKGVPRQDMTLSTFTQARDAEGFVIYKPLVQGRNSQEGHTARWPVRWSLRGSWQASADAALSASAETVPGFGMLPAVSWQQRWSGFETGLGWRFHERRATVSMAWKGWHLQLGADRLSDARSRMLSLSYMTSL